MPGQCDASTAPRVAAVITAYQPDAGLVRACQAVLSQVRLLVVVDDGSAAPDAVLEVCAGLGAVVVRHPANLGIGAALNSGVVAARQHLGPDAGAAQVLTLDQDSVVPPGYVDALTAVQQSATAAGLCVAMVGPERAEGIRSAAAGRRGAFVHSREPIQSGLLVPIRTFDEIGLFAAELFIDGVDTEFFLRAKAHGMAALVAPGVALDHRLGREHVVTVGGRRLALTYAADYRYYYIARNRITLLRRFAVRDPGWAVGALLKDLRHTLVTTLLVPGRRRRWANTLAGLRDGACGVTGRRG